jgi:hypothetical protein
VSLVLGYWYRTSPRNRSRGSGDWFGYLGIPMLFVSSQFYALGKQLGIAHAMRTVREQIAHPDCESLPAVRTIWRLQQIESIQLRIDTGATCIAKTRSRAFHDALAAHDTCDVWVAVDDDVEATLPTLQALVEAVRSSDGICLAPYILRRGSCADPLRLSIDLQSYDLHDRRTLAGGGQVVRGIGGGFGLVAMTRNAMVEIAAANPAELWDDDDGIPKLALFREQLENRSWWGEDLAFFRRVPSNVRIEVLLTGHTMHEGMGLDLAIIDRILPVGQTVLDDHPTVTD